MAARPEVRRRAATHTAAVRVATLAAIGCTTYSADTSWRFAADYFDMGSTVERAAMLPAAELAPFATALMTRQNLNGPRQAPVLPGTLTWVITAVQILPAYAETGPIGSTVRAVVGPVLAAVLWHLAMGIELRHRTPDADSRSLAAVLARQGRERLLACRRITDRHAARPRSSPQLRSPTTVGPGSVVPEGRRRPDEHLGDRVPGTEDAQFGDRISVPDGPRDHSHLLMGTVTYENAARRDRGP